MTHCKTKTIKEAYKRFLESDSPSITYCYERPSQAKENAMQYCYSLMADFDGCRPRVIGFNTMTFSFGFYGEINGKDAFFYITRDYDRFIYLDEI